MPFPVGRTRWPLLLLALAGTAPGALAATPAQEPEGLASLVDFTAVAPQVTRAFQWRYFQGHGYRGAAQVFAEDSPDGPIAAALETALGRHLDDLIAQEEAVTLAGRRRARILATTGDGLTLSDRQGEHPLAWAEVEVKDLVNLLRRRQDKDATDQVALAGLSGLLGDATNLRRATRELEGETLTRVETWIAASGDLAGEVGALGALEAAWAEADAGRFVAVLDGCWPTAGSTQVGAAVRAPLERRYEESARAALTGEQVLAAVLHGTWTATPGEGDDLVVEVTYEFADDTALQDLRTGPLPPGLRSAYRFLVSWWEPPDAFAEWSLEEGTCWSNASHLVFLDLPWSRLEDLQVTGIVKADADPQEFLQSFLSFGLHDEASGHYLATYNQWRLMEGSGAGNRPSGHKEVQTKAGVPILARIRWAESMVILERDGDTISRISPPEVRAGRFFLAAGGHPCWGVQRVFLRGTITAEVLAQQGRRLAEERTRTLFHAADR